MITGSEGGEGCLRMWPWGSPTQNEPPRIPGKGSEQDKGKPGEGVLEARELRGGRSG